MSADALRGRDLLRVLYQDVEGVLDLRAIGLDKRWPVVQTFCAPTDTDAITRFCVQHRARELYFGVALRRDASSGELVNCTWLPALFADVDFKTTPEAEARERLARCPLPPTAVVHSGGGLHCYWKFKDPIDLTLDAALAKSLLRRLAVYLGGDLASAEPAHVLRLPGRLNHKYTPARPVTVERVA
jgi:hypothetical protein